MHLNEPLSLLYVAMEHEWTQLCRLATVILAVCCSTPGCACATAEPPSKTWILHTLTIEDHSTPHA